MKSPRRSQSVGLGHLHRLVDSLRFGAPVDAPAETFGEPPMKDPRMACSTRVSAVSLAAVFIVLAGGVRSQAESFKPAADDRVAISYAGSPDEQPSADDLRRRRAQELINERRTATGGEPIDLGEALFAGEITPDNADEVLYRQHVITLSNPYFEGRAPGTKGNELAADYVRREFTRLGLEPAFGESGYYQEMQRGSVIDIAEQSLSVDGIEAKPGVQFLASGLSGDGSFTGPVAFVGYSIVSGEDGYMSYQPGTDLTGKAALVLRFEPMTENGQSQWTADGWSYHAALQRKFSGAVRRGAEAILMVSPPNADDDRAGELESPEGQQAFGRPFEGVPVIQIDPETAEAIIAAGDPAGRTLADLVASANEGGSVIDLPGVTVDVHTKLDEKPVLTNNVGGILRGRGELADEYVVVGAHYDHVGYGYFGSRDPNGRGKIHAGADDNASGTSAMLVAAKELTEAYASLPAEAEARSILFLAFTAEESGLNGSRWYVDHPIVPMEQHDLMVNLDMVGRYGDQGLEVGGVNTADGLDKLVAAYVEPTGLDYSTAMSIGGGRSDHASFDAKSVPNLFFFTGIHDDYHTPTDTFEKLNTVDATKIASAAAGIAFEAARLPEGFTYDGTGGSDDAEQPRRSVKVRVGIRPGGYGNAGGIEVAEVYEGTSAEDGGLKAGDVITSWDGKTVENVEDWMPMLFDHEPGDKVKVIVDRNGEEVELELTLKPSSSAG